MKKSKLYGSRLIEDNKLTITPELVTLESTDDVTNLTFDRGNILDAASIKLYLAATSDDLTTKYNTLNENVTTNSNDIITINTLLTTTAESINSINANITTINNSLVDYGIALEYVDNKLILKNKNSDTLSSIDLSAMTEDTYLDTVTFSNNKLIFTWNEGSSKKPITIDLSRLKDKDGNELSIGNILAKSKLLFLSKNDSDTAKGLITFMKGVRIGNYTSESGGIIDVDLITGLTYLEVDKLKVRMKAYFETLSIINELSIAGKWTISPGGSILCTRVNITAELNYKCYFTNILDNVQIENKFAVNDLAISKDFNIKTVEYQSVTNHYYWRKVLEVGEDYIVLSNTDCDTGSDAPNVGDVICQLGNTTDADRLNALVFSSVDETSPCVNLYSGINTYSLANKEYVSYGVNKATNKAFMNVYGDMYFGDRPTVDNLYEGASYVKFNSTDKKVTIKGELDVKSTVGGTKIDLYIKNNSLSETDVNSLINNSTVISDMLNLIDGAIETYFYTGVPTLSNLPTSGWVEVATETNKETYANHVGDLYYDKDTGKAYRFMKDGNTGIYSWITITDVDITKALADSSEALLTANVKKRIFYGIPIPPYDKGDLWVEATYPVGATKTDAVNNEYYSEILYCNTAKALGSSFAITDWKLSNNYTKTIGTVITDLDGYKYIKDALLNDTETSGGLILSSLIALRDSSNDILSGINGTLNPEATGKGIATWWGGKMIDGGFTPNITTTTVTDYATSLIRFDGSGYLANGNISWDTNGKIHADPTSFFVGSTNISIITSLFSTIPTDATSYSLVTKIHPTKPFDTLTADTITATTFIGELQGNAATATQLKTTHKIFGNDFNGLSDVKDYFRLNGVAGGVFDISYIDSYVAMQTYNNRFLSINADGAYVGIGTTSPAYKLDVNGNMRVTSDLYLDATIGTRNFASHTTGWRADSNGNADFRNIYADELRVQAFTADISQALAGSDYLTKSVSKLSANFVVPAVNSTVRIIVDDIEGMPATQCFSNNDYIRFRAFNRTSGLTIANVWGTVVLDTTFGTNGFLNGTQAYTFTCTQTLGAGLTVFKGSEVLDYGISGSGLIARTTLDTMGSPYEQIATWKNDPSNGNNYTVHARLGNLNGIANCNGYGLYTDNGFFTGKITVGDLTKSNHYLDFSNGALTVKGDVYLSNGDGVVGSNGVISAINLTRETAIIQASKINLNGAVTIGAIDKSSVTPAALGAATPTDVNTAVNNIQIADRNLLKNSYLSRYRSVYTPSNYTWTGVITSSGDKYWRWNLNNLISEQYVGKVTISFIAKSTIDGQISVMPSWHYGQHASLTSTDTYYSFTFDIDFLTYADWGGFDFSDSMRGATVTIKEIMISKGNIALPYRPAIEDVDASISTAQSSADAAGLAASSAQNSANTANGAIANIVSDNMLSANEKGGERDRWNVIASEKSGIDAQATTYGITTEKTAYDTAFQTLATYLNNGTTWTSGIPNWITDANLSVNTAIDGTTYRSKWQGYFDAKTALLNAIYAKAKVLADNAQGSANQAQSDATASLTRNNTMAVKLGYTDYNALASAAALGHTLIDGGMINTVLINATAVVTNGLTANCITSDKVNMSEFTASNGFVDSFNANVIATKRLDVAKIVADGIAAQTIDAKSATISNLNVVNATVSGTLNGVSGTFDYLQAVGSSGRLIFANTYGSLAIEDDDFIQQGTKNNRTLRFLSSNIRCRGSFGASSLNMARVHDTVIDYYVNGDLNSYVRFNLQSNGVGGYYIPLYPSSVTGYDSVYGNAVLGDEKGFPVDLVVFDNSAAYQYELVRGNPNKKVTVINANNNYSSSVYLMMNGANDWKIAGGEVHTFINIREFMTPLVSTYVHGAGWMLCGKYDNNWA